MDNKKHQDPQRSQNNERFKKDMGDESSLNNPSVKNDRSSTQKGSAEPSIQKGANTRSR